jgi:WD40 repeat protein
MVWFLVLGSVNGIWRRTLEVFFTPAEEQREARITDLCFSPDNRCLATGELDGTIRVSHAFS